MFKYSSTSHTTTYIQEILHQNYIPLIPSLNIGNRALFEDKLKLIDSYTYNQHIYNKGNLQCKWEFGENIPNITANYISRQSYYSTEVHEQLGNYLRAYRDYYGIDLMSFYNCYSGRLISNFGLPITARTNINNVTTWWQGPIKVGSKVTCFPIRVGATYRIKIYNNVRGSVEIQPLFFNNGKLLKIAAQPSYTTGDFLAPGEPIGVTSEFTYKATIDRLLVSSLCESKCTCKENNTDKTCRCHETGQTCSCTICRVRDRDAAIQQLLRKQKYLYLFLQIPTTEDLRISVIESAGYPVAIHNSLLNLENINYNVPFSDRLLEYLTGNVITSVDPIPHNVEVIQQIISSEDFRLRFGKKFTDTYSKGIYDENMRLFLYHLFADYKDAEGNCIKDYLGYVDKDIEYLLWDCLSVEFKNKLLER